MSILLSSADTVLPGVNPSRIPGGLDVRESLPAAEQAWCFLLTSPFIEPAGPASGGTGTPACAPAIRKSQNATKGCKISGNKDVQAVPGAAPG